MTERTDLRAVPPLTERGPAARGAAETSPENLAGFTGVSSRSVSGGDPVFEMVAEIFERGNLLLEETVRRIRGELV